MPCSASLAERVPLGMTTPSKTMSVALAGFFTAILFPSGGDDSTSFRVRAGYQQFGNKRYRQR
jgi:hypothetical protein